MANNRYFFIACFLGVWLTTISACGGGGGGSSGGGPPPEPATSSTISGTILDSHGNPVPNARIQISSDSPDITTDENGYFSVTLNTGDYTLTVSRKNTFITEYSFSVSDASPIELGKLIPTKPYYPWYADNDGDGYGDTGNFLNSKTRPAGQYVIPYGDCDDSDANINPDTAWHKDNDGDGYYAKASGAVQCRSPAGTYSPGHLITVYDCNDSNRNINPGATEITGNGLNDDCDFYTTDYQAFASAQLAGRYRLSGIDVGDIANGDWTGWERGDIRINQNGTITEYQTILSDSTSTNSPPGTLKGTLLPSGLITFSLPAQAIGTMSLNTQNIAVLEPGEGTAFNFTLLQRIADDFTLADLAGDWSFHAITINESSGNGVVLNGTHKIDAGGVLISRMNYGSTSQLTDADVFQMDAFGQATKGPDWTGIYTLSADHNLLASVYTDDEFNHVLELSVKSDGAYSISDLYGDWLFTVLTTGSEAKHNAMGYGALRIKNTGQGEILSQTWSSPVAELADGKLEISASGIITHADIPGFHGQLSPDHNLFIATYGEMTGAMGLLVGQRRHSPPTIITPDETRKVSASTGFSGSKLETVSEDGTVYSLDIPPGALLEDVMISIAPVASTEGNMPDGEILGLLQFEPDGLRLQKPATLTIARQGGSLPGELLGFNYNGGGPDLFAFQPARKRPDGKLELDILHFSGAGASTGSPSQQTNPDAVYTSQVNHIFATAKANGLSPFDPDVRTALEAVFEAWIRLSLTPRANTAQDLDEMDTLIARLLDMAALWQQLGYDEGELCPIAGSSGLVNAINTRSETLFQDYSQTCATQQSSCTQYAITQEALQFITRMQLLGGSCGFDNPDISEAHTFCNSFLLNHGVYGKINPQISSVPVGEQILLTADTKNTLLEKMGEVEEWTIRPPSDIATLLRAGPNSAKVTGKKTGMTVISARTDGCAPMKAFVNITPMVDGTWSVKTDSRYDVKQSPSCASLETPEQAYTVDIVTTGKSITVAGAMAIDWSGGGGGEVFRPEHLTGNQRGGRVELKGTATWPEAAGEPVRRKCNLYFVPKAGSQSARLKGTCTFKWTGMPVPGQGYTGCYGTDEITATRILPPLPPITAP